MELNLRVVLLLVMALFIFGILFESFRRQRQRKSHDSVCTDLDNKITETEKMVGLTEEEGVLSQMEIISSTAAETDTFVVNKEIDKEVGQPSPSFASEASCLQSATEKDLIIFYIMPRPAHVFHGHELKQTLYAAGFNFGTMKIFDYQNPAYENNNILFCVSSAFEPGVFDITHMSSDSFAGLCLFMSIQHQEPMMIFDIMLNKANDLAYRLQANLCDNQREPVDDDYTLQCRERIRTLAFAQAN